MNSQHRRRNPSKRLYAKQTNRDQNTNFKAKRRNRKIYFFSLILAALLILLLVRNRILVWIEDSSYRISSSSSLSLLTSHIKPRLRFDWTNLPIQSEAAIFFRQHQNNCTLPLAQIPFRNRFGLGSDLHVWTQAVCNAASLGYRVEATDPWIWLDPTVCSSNYTDAIGCYFAKATAPASCSSSSRIDQPPIVWKARQGYNCEEIMPKKYNVSDFRAGGIEFLFSSVSPAIVEEAERLLPKVFPPDGIVPPNLITVQIRRGDKLVEDKSLKKLSIQTFIDSVRKLANPHLPIHVFLATEDKGAMEEFQQNAPSDWTIHLDPYHTELKALKDSIVTSDQNFSHSKGNNYNENPRLSVATKGKSGLISLASMLISMEANSYVLTTTSNWSRLMNELRKTIVEDNCGVDCRTRVIDLKPGEW